MKDSDRYAKLVEWSEEDQIYIGSCPNLFYGGCHGLNQVEVFEELCQLVEETIQLYHQEGKPLPQPTAGRDWSKQLQQPA